MKKLESNIIIAACLVIIYNLCILAGTFYAVFILQHSGWWFALAFIMMASLDTDKEES
jgi:hypothetical protein